MKKYKLTEQNRHLADSLQDTYIDEEKGILYSKQDLSSLGLSLCSQQEAPSGVLLIKQIALYDWLAILLGIIGFSVLFIPFVFSLIQELYLSTEKIIPKPIYCQTLKWEQRDVVASYNEIMEGVQNSKIYGFESPEIEARFNHEKNIIENRKKSMDKAIAWCKS
ncbi:MAG: hypothetical protein QNJ72_23895 [Pleurocapsa sp. MO_226.B13]|nr:hypothetical protein [Pleurocapsa sp. MO_226.B13]